MPVNNDGNNKGLTNERRKAFNSWLKEHDIKRPSRLDDDQLDEFSAFARNEHGSGAVFALLSHLILVCDIPGDKLGVSDDATKVFWTTSS